MVRLVILSTVGSFLGFGYVPNPGQSAVMRPKLRAKCNWGGEDDPAPSARKPFPTS
jgi:hypothetical protein